jgi:hypothetical protein
MPANILGPCPLCGRDLVEGPSVNAHHLIPKTYKGNVTVLVHTICHSKIHSVFTEWELYHHYHTIERLRAHPEIEKFIHWVARKDPEFKSRNEAHRAKARKR